MAVEIIEIHPEHGDLRKFVNFAIKLYEKNDYYVPSLVVDEINTLTPSKNPAFEFCEAKYFMAYRDGQPVGRIAAIINKVVNERTKENAVRFGFVDFIDDNEVVDALFDVVTKWGKEKGMNVILGPLGFTDMDPEGMLVDGYDQVGTMATIYNFPYYVKHIERLNMKEDAQWVEYKIQIPDDVPEKHQRIGEIVNQKYGIHSARCKSKKELVQKYGHEMFQLINEAYDELYCYSPLSPKQIDHYLKMYVPIVKLNDLSAIVDKDDNLVGVGLAMPSLSDALINGRGKLFPFGWYHLIKSLRGRNKTVDLLLIAVKPEYQNKGVNALIFNDMIRGFIKNGYTQAESNPELHMNQKVQSQWQYFDHVQHKKRKSFKKEII